MPGRHAEARIVAERLGSAAAPARFEALVLPHLDAAYNLARFLSRDPEAARDIVQEACLRAFRSIDACRGVDARPWLFAIVRNCFYTWAEARRSRPATVPLDADGSALNGAPVGDPAGVHGAIAAAEPWIDDETPERAALRTSEVAAIRATIEALPEPFREVLVLRELEELSYREIAQATGVPIGTVMSRLARARELFAAAWQRRYGEADTRAPARPVGEAR